MNTTKQSETIANGNTLPIVILMKRDLCPRCWSLWHDTTRHISLLILFFGGYRRINSHKRKLKRKLNIFANLIPSELVERLDPREGDERRFVKGTAPDERRRVVGRRPWDDRYGNPDRSIISCVNTATRFTLEYANISIFWFLRQDAKIRQEAIPEALQVRANISGAPCLPGPRVVWCDFLRKRIVSQYDCVWGVELDFFQPKWKSKYRFAVI